MTLPSALSSWILPVFCLTAIGLAMAAAGYQSHHQLTLEEIFASARYDSPNPTNLRWLPDGSAFLYTIKKDEETWLVREDVETGRREQIAEWDKLLENLDRQRPDYQVPPMNDVNRTGRQNTGLQVAPDGDWLLGSTSGDLFRVDLHNPSGARFLTHDAAPELFAGISPDGNKVGFARDGDLYWIDSSGGTQHQLTSRGDNNALLNGVADWVYEEELGVRRSWWWSPDSSRVLFVQYDTSPIPLFTITDELHDVARVEAQRYPKAGGRNSLVRLGVVTSDRKIDWIDTGSENDSYIARAGWLPDGEGIWYQWLNRDQDELQLRFVDLHSGASRLVIRETDDKWINIRDDFRFVDDERFLWSSERDGWRHLYLYSKEGKLLRRLTEGSFQIESTYGFDSSRSRVLFQGAAPDPRLRHLFSIRLDGDGVISRLSKGGGTHRGLLAPGGRYLLDTWSTTTSPPRIDLLKTDGELVRTIASGEIAALAELQLAPIEFDTLQAGDGEWLHYAMIKPPDFDSSKRYPVLVYVYGGPHAQTVTDAWFDRRQLFFNYLAQEGLIVFWLDNRGSWGRGLKFEQAVHRQLGTRELEDQIDGVRFLKSLAYVDSERIGVYGGSYGGYMALTCLFKAPEHFKVGVAYAPVTDWRFYDTIYTERYMDRPQDNPEGYARSAPLNFAEQLEGKLLLFHGLLDNNVHFQNSVQLVERLTRSGKDFEVMFYPRVRHGIRTSQFKFDFHRRKAKFLLQHLAGSPSSD